MGDQLLNIPGRHEATAELKFAILANGLRLTPRADATLFENDTANRAKKPLRTRSGVSGGLDLRLSADVFVNAPVAERFAKSSDLVLDILENGFGVWRGDEFLANVTPLPEPRFYARETQDGTERLSRIGQMCSPDRFCYGMTGPGCSFWPKHERCRYCSIGFNKPDDATRKREDHLYEALEAAIDEPEWPARHVLLGGGTPVGDDMGALLAAQLCSGIKQRFDLPVYVMIAAPLKNEFIRRLHDAGVDELGINLEFWSDAAWDKYIPGKRDRIGKTRFLEALEYSVSLFGPVRTRSILIAGLESPENTLHAVMELTQRSVMPILSPFRPLAGTQLANTKGFSTAEYITLYNEAKGITDKAQLPLGPTCICCQNNTLALPFGDFYCRYGGEGI